MRQYWVKSSADAQAQGPLTAMQVKRRAAAGEITRDSLISMDQVQWHPAGRVKGVFSVAKPAAGVPAAPAFAESIAAAASWDQDGFGDAAATEAEPVAPSPASRPARRAVSPPPSYPGAVRRSIPSRPIAAREIETPEAIIASQPTSPPMAEVGDGTIESQPPMPMPPLMPPIAPSREPTETSPDAPPQMQAPPALPMPPPPPQIVTRPAMPPAVAFAAPGTGSGLIAPRKTGVFLAVAMMALPVGLLHAFMWYISFALPRRPDLELLRTGVCLIWIPFAVVALMMWLKWISAAHKDVGALTGYRYPVSPSRATTFFLIPVFNAYWTVAAPSKLAAAVNAALDAAGQPKISRGGVTVFQLVSVLVPFLGLYAFTPLLNALSMRIVQGGLNRLATAQYAR